VLTNNLFTFLIDLKANNSREWFHQNKDRYEDEVREPLLQFVRDFAPQLEEISPYFMAVAKKSGGALFRIHRDVRFSKDKSPYKTNAGLHFRHEDGKDAHAPGFYLHIDPAECFCGAGLWRPDSASLRLIREAIVEKPEEWERVTAPIRDCLSGDSLKRAPKGFDPEHPLIEDLRRKDHVAMRTLTQNDVLRKNFLKSYVEQCESFAGYVQFLCRALGQPF
jgi:uncharacterized protein (TIGR02453 family)